VEEDDRPALSDAIGHQGRAFGALELDSLHPPGSFAPACSAMGILLPP
jgi:hypothetical protein